MTKIMETSPYYRNGRVSDQFGAILVVLAEALGVFLSEARIREYAIFLGDLTLEELQQACTRAVNEPRDPSRPVYFPTPGQLRAYLTPPIEDQAVIAWVALCRGVKQYGAYTSVVVDDVCAAEALLAVCSSWAEFCQIDEGPALAQKRQEFLIQYRQIRRATGKNTHGSKRLAGLCEQSANYDPDNPGFVGTITTQSATETKNLPPAALPPWKDRQK